MTRIPGSLTAPPARTWTLGTAPWQAIPPASAPRARVIIDNDFSGDPDDLYQLVHHLLSPSVEIPLIVASHLRPGDHFDPSEQQAENARPHRSGRLRPDGAAVHRRHPAGLEPAAR